ncbi:hypothetical protein Tco_0472922 [Tanacetum coccineum]
MSIDNVCISVTLDKFLLRETRMAGKGCALHHWVHDVVFNLSCLLKEQLLEPALNLTVHCCGLEFRVLNGYDQKSFDEERGLN